MVGAVGHADLVEQLHRALARFPIDRRGAAWGLVVSILIVGLSFTFTHAIWNTEATGLKAMLRMSQTPFTITPPPNPAPGLLGGTIKGGPTFVVEGSRARTPLAAGIGGIAVFGALSVIAIRWRKIPVPAKVLWLLFAVLGVATLWYTAFVSGNPPQPINSLTISFQRGGLLGVMVAVVLFAVEVFPVPGRLRSKLGWLLVLVGFSAVWSVVRMAFVLATVHHVGSWTFLYLQYLAGPMVDFLSVVAVYSLATHGLARRLEEHIA
ncbi:MAG: hypothetical protein NVSMB57_10660 [Actinomycetota bacterium]